VFIVQRSRTLDASADCGGAVRTTDHFQFVWNDALTIGEETSFVRDEPA